MKEEDKCYWKVDAIKKAERDLKLSKLEERCLKCNGFNPPKDCIEYMPIYITSFKKS